jgi:uncharacterized membrane protein YhaH (DUF805 family)
MDRIRFLFDINGRVPRRSFAVATAVFVAGMILAWRLALIFEGGALGVGLALGLPALAMILAYGAFAVRRLHDLGRSGLWLWAALAGLRVITLDALRPHGWLLAVVAVAVSIPALVAFCALLILPSQLGENAYGLDPLSGRALRLRRA